MMSNSDYCGQTKVYHVTYSREYGVCSLFFWGCNFRCRICYLHKEAYDCHLSENSQRMDDPLYRRNPPQKFLSLYQLTRLLEPLSIKKVFLMGAEATQDSLLSEILHYLKESKMSFISLLTNGSKRAPLFLLDEVVLSIKAITPGLHREYTGEDNGPVVRHLREITDQRIVSLRTETVFIPDYVDESEVMKIAELISSVDRNIPFHIDAYWPMPGLPWREPSVREIEALRDRLITILPNTTCLHGKTGGEEVAYEMEEVF